MCKTFFIAKCCVAPAHKASRRSIRIHSIPEEKKIRAKTKEGVSFLSSGVMARYLQERNGAMQLKKISEKKRDEDRRGQGKEVKGEE